MTEREESAARIVLGGFLMGVANLVPGVSGGTMILAIGLYDRFIEVVARMTSLRWSRPTLVFTGLLGIGAVVAILGLSAPAVWLVVEHRWIAYSLFVGMTLGGVPLLWKAVRPLGGASLVLFLLALAGMVWVARGMSDSPLPHTFPVFVFVGAVAASSMILPGISGSYVLLIFGMYDAVVGSLRPRDLMDDPVASLWIVAPVGIGVALGIGLLSNVLKLVLARYEKPTHAALLGLLLGSVAGLWPFQEAVHPDLVSKRRVEAVLLVLDGADVQAIEAETGVALDEGQRAGLAETYAGHTKGDLKLLGLQLAPYSPGPLRIGVALALLVGGFTLTRLLGRE
jgi:putative membrane protein